MRHDGCVVYAFFKRELVIVSFETKYALNIHY